MCDFIVDQLDFLYTLAACIVCVTCREHGWYVLLAKVPHATNLGFRNTKMYTTLRPCLLYSIHLHIGGDEDANHSFGTHLAACVMH